MYWIECACCFFLHQLCPEYIVCTSMDIACRVKNIQRKSERTCFGLKFFVCFLFKNKYVRILSHVHLMWIYQPTICRMIRKQKFVFGPHEWESKISFEFLSYRKILSLPDIFLPVRKSINLFLYSIELFFLT